MVRTFPQRVGESRKGWVSFEFRQNPFGQTRAISGQMALGLDTTHSKKVFVAQGHFDRLAMLSLSGSISRGKVV
jgi:hypothetical protein